MPKQPKIKVRSVIVCEGVRTETSGQHTIVGAFLGNMLGKNAPIEMPRLTFRFELETNQEFEEEYSFSLMTPSKTRLFNSRNMLRVEKSKRTILSIVVGPVIFTESGTYNIRLGPVGRERIVDKFTIKFGS